MPHRGTPPAMRGGIALQMQVPNRAKGLGIRLPALWEINRDHSFQMFSRFKRVSIGIFCPSLFPFSGCAGGDVEEIIGRQGLLTGLVHAPYLGVKHWWWWSCLFYRLLLYEFQSFFPLVFPLFFFPLFYPLFLWPKNLKSTFYGWKPGNSMATGAMWTALTPHRSAMSCEFLRVSLEQNQRL